MLRKLTYIIIVALVSVFYIPSVQAANMIDNNGFERGDISGWSSASSGFSITDSEQHSGRYSLKLGSGGYESGFFVKNPNPNLEAGREYIFTAWYKMKYTGDGQPPKLNANGSNSFLFFVRSDMRSTGGTDVFYLDHGKSGGTGGTLINDGQWHQFVHRFTPVAGNTTITNLGVRDYNAKFSELGMEYYFDDFYLSPSTTGILTNGDFEDASLIPWLIPSGLTNFQITTDDKYSGNSSLKLTGTNSLVDISQIISADSNSAYEVSFVSKGDAGGNVQICNASGADLSAPVVFENNVDWKKYVIRSNYSADGRLMIKITDTLNGTRYFDDFIVEPFSGIGAEVNFNSGNASAYITNYTGLPQNVYAILGSYDSVNGIMTEYDTIQIDDLPGGQSDDVNLSVPFQAGNKLMVFLWDRHNTMKPLSKIYTPDGTETVIIDREGSGIEVKTDLNGNITISGGLGISQSSGIGALRITKDGFKPTDNNVLLYAFPVGSKGGYSIDFKIPQSYPSGIYDIEVRGAEPGSRQTTSFYFINQVTISKIVSDINKITDKNSLLAFLTGENAKDLTLLGLDIDTFKNLEIVEQQEVCDVLIRAKALDIVEDSQYNGFNGETLRYKFNDAMRVFNFNKSVKTISGNKSAVVLDALKALDADTSQSSIYSKVGPSHQMWVIDKVIESEFVRVNDIIDEFEKTSALAFVSSANKSSMKHYLLNTDALSEKIVAILELDLSNLKKLSSIDIDKVFENLTKNYNSISEFKSALDTAIRKVTDPIITPSRPSGGSSGGSIGGSTVLTLSVPEQNPVVEQIPAKKPDTSLTGNITWGEVFELLASLGYVPDSAIPETVKVKETPFARELVHRALQP